MKKYVLKMTLYIKARKSGGETEKEIATRNNGTRSNEKGTVLFLHTVWARYFAMKNSETECPGASRVGQPLCRSVFKSPTASVRALWAQGVCAAPVVWALARAARLPPTADAAAEGAHGDDSHSTLPEDARLRTGGRYGTAVEQYFMWYVLGHNPLEQKHRRPGGLSFSSPSRGGGRAL